VPGDPPFGRNRCFALGSLLVDESLPVLGDHGVCRVGG
jgi:hypothetical protein